tara:strand:- start:671 stop:850 length:180 start_codon:yes stop_codon:yes gene_type:complete
MVAYIGESGEQTSSESVIRQHENTIVQSVTIQASNNAVTAGVVTIDNAVVKVEGTWVIV